MQASSAVDVDLALVGGGGAASLVLAALDRHGVTGLRVAVVDPVHKRGQDRTWAFWGLPGDDLDPLLSASWSQVDVVTRAGRRVLTLDPLRYAMLRSAPVYDRAAAAERRLDAVRISAPAGELHDDGERVTVRDPEGRELVRAGWVLDSRPRRPKRPGRTSWLQHFRGWWLAADRPTFDPQRAVLMDFRTPQPQRGVSFGYVLPVDDRFALVEYTEFGPELLDDAGYDAALRGYADLLGLEPVPEHRITLVDARDLDPPEAEYLAGARITRCEVADVDEPLLPDGPIYLHVDFDVIDCGELPGLLFPVPGGPSRKKVAKAIRRVLDTGRVVAVGGACTWLPGHGAAALVEPIMTGL